MPQHVVRRRAGVLVAALVLLAVGVLPGAAGAHETDPTVMTELTAVRPALPDGVTVQVVTSVEAQLVAENTTETELIVEGADGEPFLRIGPEGVLANLSSPDWYLSNDPSGAAPVPPRALGGDAPPSWARVSQEPSWGWFDHRLHEERRIFAEVAQEAEVLSTWELPMRYGDQRVTVEGRVVRRPVSGGIVAELRDGPEVAPGLTLALLPGRLPGLFLTSEREDAVTVLGAAGEPFLRLGPDGAEANLRSPTWAEHAAARGQLPPEVVDPDAPPRWEAVADVPRYGWLEPRTRPETAPPEAVTTGDRVVTLGAWEIPIELGDGEVVLARGSTRWQPASAATDSGAGTARPLALGLAVLLVVTLVGAALTRRRRRRAPREQEEQPLPV